MSENFTKLVESFYGSTIGNVRSPVWMCGLEWGGGYDSKIPILESELEPYGLEDIQTTSLQDFIDNFWASGSPFCRNTMKIYAGCTTAQSLRRKPLTTRIGNLGKSWES